MKPRISIITLAVDNLERSLNFYRDGLGLPTQGITDDHVAFFLEGDLALVVILTILTGLCGMCFGNLFFLHKISNLF